MAQRMIFVEFRSEKAIRKSHWPDKLLGTLDKRRVKREKREKNADE